MTKMTLEEKLTKAFAGHATDEVIPVLSAYLAGLAVWSNTSEEGLITFVCNVIRDTYKINRTPPQKELN